MKINQNLIYKWTLRFRYIWVFLLGSGLCAFSISVFFGLEEYSKREELNNFASFLTIIFGIALILLGFYRKNAIERYILKQNL